MASQKFTLKQTANAVQELLDVVEDSYESKGELVTHFKKYQWSDPLFVVQEGYYRSTDSRWERGGENYITYYFVAPSNFHSIYLTFTATEGYIQILTENPEGTYVRRVRTLDNNMPTEEAPYEIKEGDVVYISIATKQMSSKIGCYINLTEGSPILLSNNVALNTNQISQAQEKSCMLQYMKSGFANSSATEGFKLYFPAATGYIQQDFEHNVNEDSKCDCWRLDQTNVVDDNRNEIMTVCSAGPEWEMAVHIKDVPDFIGGYAHGDEIMQSISFFLDGKLINPENLTLLTRFTELRVIETSIGYNPGNEEEEALTHIKEYIFTKEGYTVHQRVKWLKAYELQSGCYLGMMPTRKTTEKYNQEITLTDACYSDIDYKSQDIVNEVGTRISFQGAHSGYVYGKTSGFSAHMEFPTYPDKESGGYMMVTDNSSESYNKMYFVTAMTGNVVANEEWVTTTKWKFQYKE